MATCAMCGTTIKGSGTLKQGKHYCSKKCATLDTKHDGKHQCEFC